MSKKYNDIKVKNNMEVIDPLDVEEMEKKPLERVVAVQPKKVKRNLIGRLVMGVLGPDGAEGIGEYVAEEIVKPALKNIVVDVVTSGINQLMYGERGGQHRGGGYQRTNYSQNYGRQHDYQRTSYNQSYESRQYSAPRAISRNRHGVEEYLIEDRYDASHVLTTLTEHADNYNTVSVADYYDLIGVPSVYTDNSYGWTMDTIVRATIMPVRGGYVIKFPPTEVIG